MAKRLKLDRDSSGRFLAPSLEQRYDQYLEIRREMVQELKAKGKTPFVEDALSLTEFETHYKGANNLWREQNNVTDPKENLKLNKTYIENLVDSEKYELTKAQAKGFQKIVMRETVSEGKPFGIRLTLEEIRSKEFRTAYIGTNPQPVDFEEIGWGAAKREYWQLRDEGNTGKAAGEEIARRHFGSP